MVRLLGLLRRCYRGQGGRWSTGGEQSRRRRVLPAAALVEKSGACRLEVEGSKLGEGLAHGAELQMLLVGAGRPWRGRSAAEQRCGGSAEQDVRRLGYGRGAAGRGWGREGRRANYRRGPGISAGHSGIMIPSNSPVISAAALRCREKGMGGEPLTCGPAGQ